LVRAKTSEAVAEYILEQLFDGTLRSGDRIDLDEVADSLGVSRAPVREALLHLERDGLVRMPHYRGAYVAEFHAGTVREAFQLYALLSALTSSRVAVSADEGTLESLAKLSSALAGTRQVDEFERLAREFRRVLNLAAAGPHLRALLRTFTGLVVAAARFSIQEAMDDERAALDRELAAVRARDPAEAAAATLDHITMTGENALRTLRRRGVFGDSPGGPTAGPTAEPTVDRVELLGLLDAERGRLGHE
jgi:DNA-binding GntR family transcriptional regulator